MVANPQNHRLLEGEVLSDVLAEAGTDPAQPGDVVYRLMNDGTRRIEVVAADLTLAVVFELPQTTRTVIAQLGLDPEGRLTVGGEVIEATPPEPVTIAVTTPLSLVAPVDGAAISTALLGAATASDGSQVDPVVTWALNGAAAVGTDIAAAGQELTAVAYFSNGTVETAPVNLGPVTVSAITTADSLTDGPVTWNLTNTAQSGTYFDGSPWCLEDAGNSMLEVSPASALLDRTMADGSVRLARVSHGLTMNAGQAEVQGTLAEMQASNDGLISGNARGHGYDSVDEISNFKYTDALNIDPGNTGNPVPLVEGSYCKAVSQITGIQNQARPALEDMRVLTVVPSPPAADALRPGLAAVSKVSRVRASDIDLSVLPSLSGAGVAVLDFAASLAALRFQTEEHTYNVHCRHILVDDGSGAPVYAGDRYVWTEAMLALCFDTWTAEEKQQIAVALVQIAEELTARAEQGGIWQDNAGHCAGRQTIIAFAARVTGLPHFIAMRDATTTLFINGGGVASIWGEDRQIFEVDQPDVDRPRVFPYVAEQIGVFEWSSDATRDDPDNPNNEEARQNTLAVDADGVVEPSANNRIIDRQNYRHIIARVNVPAALALRLMGSAAALSDRFMGYQDRHMDARIAFGGDLPQGDNNPITPWVVDMWIAHRGTMLSSVASVFSIAQSEAAYTTNGGAFYRQIAAPVVTAPGQFILIQRDGAKDTVGPIVRTVLTNENRDTINPAQVVLANALHYILPDWTFIHGEAHEPGTGRVSLADSTDDASGERTIANTTEVLDALRLDHPSGPTRFSSFHYADDNSTMVNWTGTHAPYYFRQNADGTPFTLGTVNPVSGRQVDLAIYDFNTPQPSDLGEGILARTVPYDIMRKGPWTNDSVAKWDGFQAFIDDSRYVALGGSYGPVGSMWLSDGAHPIRDDPDGIFEAAFDFQMASFLRAAGLTIEESEFTTAVYAANGEHVDVTYAPAIGGVGRTKRSVKGQAVIQGDLAQELFGFEITRATDGKSFGVGRVGSNVIEARFTGTVVWLDDTTARITPTVPFVDGDAISYMHGRSFWHDDYAEFPSGWDWQADPAKYIVSAAIEHVPAYTDLDAPYPFSGFPVRTYSPVWTFGGASTGDGETGGGGGGGSAPTGTANLTMTAAGPYFKEVANVPPNTTIIRHLVRMRVPGSLPSLSGSTLLFSQSSQGLDIDLTTSNGQAMIFFSKIETGNGNRVTPDDNNIWVGTRDTWVDLDIAVDQAAGEVRIITNGGPPVTRPFNENPTTGVFQSTRNLSWLANTNGNDLLQAGVEIDYIETYLTTDGVEQLHVRFDETNFGNHPWRQTL